MYIIHLVTNGHGILILSNTDGFSYTVYIYCMLKISEILNNHCQWALGKHIFNNSLKVISERMIKKIPTL